MIIVKKLTIFLANVKPEIVFLIIASACGLVFTVIVPPFQVSDEFTHFLRAYQVSQGTVYPVKLSDGQYGGMMPQNMLPFYKDVTVPYNAFEPSDKASLKQLWHFRSTTIDKSKLVPMAFTNTAIYSPMPYVPQVIGIDIARILPGETRYLLAFYLARLFNLAAAIALSYWAIKKIPFAKWGVVVVFLTPMALFQIASVSSDAVTLGLTALAVALGFASIVTTERVKNRELLTLATLCVLTALLRVPYALFSIIPFIALVRSLGLRFALKKTLAFSALVGLVSAGLFLAWQLRLDNPNFNPMFGTSTISVARQLHTIRNIPWMLSVLVQTHLSNTLNYVVSGVVGFFGQPPLPLPQWLITGYFFFLIVTVFILTPGERKIRKRWLRWLCFSLFLVSCLIIDIAEYLYASSVKSPYIENIQGRYYLPLIVLIMIAAQGSIVLSKTDWRKFHLSRLSFIALAQIVAILVVLNRYWLR